MLNRQGKPTLNAIEVLATTLGMTVFTLIDVVRDQDGLNPAILKTASKSD